MVRHPSDKVRQGGNGQEAERGPGLGRGGNSSGVWL